MSNDSQPLNSGTKSEGDLRVTVLHLLGGQTLKGGTCTFAIQLTRQRSPEIEQRIWMRRGFVPEEPDLPLVRGGCVSKVPSSLLGDLLGGLAEAWPLRSWIARNRPVILHAHSRMGMVAGALASKLTGVPLVLNFHFRARHWRMYRWLWSWANAALVFNSRETCEHYGCDPRQALIIMPPISWPEMPPPEHAPLQRFVMAGTYVRLKNLHLVIDAFNQLTARGESAELVIYGRVDQPFDPVYEAEITTLARSNPHIFLKNYDPAWASRLAGTDIFVHAARGEAFGIVMLEAFARGCRLVVPPSTFLDDLPGSIGSAGIFRARAFTADDLLEQMRLAQTSQASGSRYWEARQSVRPLFSGESAGRRLRDLYQSLAPPI